MSSITSTSRQKDYFLEHFGRAIFLSQQLEQTIISAYLYIAIVPRNLALLDDNQKWRAAVFSQTNQLYEKTLGGMIKTLCSTGEIDHDSTNLLKTALTHRNCISHGFFKPKFDNDDWSAVERSELYQKIELAVVSFCKAGAALEEKTDSLRIQYGLQPMKSDRAYKTVQSYYDHAP